MLISESHRGPPGPTGATGATGAPGVARSGVHHENRPSRSGGNNDDRPSRSGANNDDRSGPSGRRRGKNASTLTQYTALHTVIYIERSACQCPNKILPKPGFPYRQLKIKTKDLTMNTK